MVPRLAGGLIAVLAMLVGVPALSAEPIVLKPAFKPGQEIVYDASMRVSVQQKLGEAAPRESGLTCAATLKILITAAEPDGSARATLEVARVKLDSAEGEQATGYEWPTEKPLTDDAPASARLGAVLAAAKVELEVDAAGEVRVAGGLAEFVEAAAKADKSEGRLAGFFTPTKLAALVTPIFKLDGAGAAEREPGKGWQTRDVVPLPPVAALDITTEWSLDSVNPDAAAYSGRLSFELRRPAEPPPNSPGVALGEVSGSTSVGFDRRRSLLKQRRNALDIQTRWTMGEIALLQSQKSSVEIVLK